MSATDKILDVAVLGFTVGVASNVLSNISKPIKKGSRKAKNIWGF